MAGPNCGIVEATQGRLADCLGSDFHYGISSRYWICDVSDDRRLRVWPWERVSGPLVGVQWVLMTRPSWLIAASASVVGSICSVIVSRTIFAGYVQRLVSHDKRFTALALTLKHDGLKLLVMIRLCPLPYSLCNGAMSTFPTVHPLMYGLATAIASFKLAIHVFIGGRLGDLAERGGKMDAGTKAVNYISIAFSLVLGVVIGWVIYQRYFALFSQLISVLIIVRTLSRAAQLENEERAQLDPAHEESIGNFTDDADEDAASDDAIEYGDEISLFETTSPDEAYRDEDTDDDVFAHGDSDIERTAGLDKEGRPSSP